jgi:hypothetical protein
MKNYKKEIDYQKSFEAKIDKCKKNHLNEFASEEIEELKISGIHQNKKFLENKFYNNGSHKKNQNLYKYYEANNIIDNSKQIKTHYINNDIKSICVINTRKNMNNNIIKISNINKSPQNSEFKNSKNMQMVICKTDSLIALAKQQQKGIVLNSWGESMYLPADMIDAIWTLIQEGRDNDVKREEKN